MKNAIEQDAAKDCAIDTRLHRAAAPEPDPMWSNEGRNDPASTDATRKALRAAAKWLLVAFGAIVLALAFNGGAWR